MRDLRDMKYPYQANRRLSSYKFMYVPSFLQCPEKRVVYDNMRGSVAIELVDIETAVTLVFAAGKLRIEEGIVGHPEIVIRTASERVMDLNALRIVGGLPWYFDEAGRRVLGHLVSGRLKIEGLFTHPVLLTQLTKIMSVI